MKSIKFLLLSIALIAHSAYPMAGIATAFKKYLPHAITTTGVVASNLYWAASEVGGHLMTQDIQNDPYLVALNEEPQTKSIVKDLLDTYAGGENIKIYSTRNTPGTQIDRDQLDAFALKTSKIVGLYAVHREALEDEKNSMHHATRAIVGHELGHARKYHIFRTLDIAQQVSTSAALYGFLKSGLFQRSHWALKLALWPAAVSLKFATDFCGNLASGKVNEYLADQNVIRHAKDPKDLRGIASFFKGYVPANYVHSFLDTHQHPLERAQAFEKAADALEKRLAKQKSL